MLLTIYSVIQGLEISSLRLFIVNIFPTLCSQTSTGKYCHTSRNTHTLTCTHTHTHTHIYIYIYIYIYMHNYTHVYTCTYPLTHAHAYTHTRIYPTPPLRQGLTQGQFLSVV